MLVSDFTIILLESQNYEMMFRPLLDQPVMADLPQDAKNQVLETSQYDIQWAKTVLKRKDRITWYLRFARIVLLRRLLKMRGIDEDHRTALYVLEERFLQDANMKPDDSFLDYNSAMEDLTHFMGIDDPRIQNLRFEKQHPNDIFDQFHAWQNDWQASRKETVEHSDKNDILIDFHDGWAWVNLNVKNCDQEANAMGHCGNRFGKAYHSVLSLRKLLPNGRWRPSLTFILDTSNGQLGEMKGRANEKPAAKYHDMIIALLLNPIVEGIVGGGHEPENNFAMSDLTEEQRTMVYNAKPELMFIFETLHTIKDDKPIVVVTR